jgi:hypothetical protein
MGNKDIKFWYGMGFAGSSYTLEVNGGKYRFEWMSEEKARQMIMDKLKELNIPYTKEIIFEWDGTL